mmetsp:Transcript_30326/g.29650  ORF Transcript_30326/g.29650 Transcript_30326/m.29650 type:complete len:203 (-) Transcript_30326:919-1527(-)
MYTSSSFLHWLHLVVMSFTFSFFSFRSCLLPIIWSSSCLPSSVALNSRKAVCLSMGFLFFSLCFFSRMISILLSSSSSCPSFCSSKSSSNICFILSSFSFAISILLVGLAVLGATPRPNSPLSSRSPTPSWNIIVFRFSNSFVSSWKPSPGSCSTLPWTDLARCMRLTYTFFICAKSSLTCLMEDSSSMSSNSPSMNFLACT